MVWIGLTFWVTYLIDYWLLVRGFAIEFPWHGRAVLLVITGAVLGFILYRWILRRAFVRMADRSMAILLERQFKDFHDSLVTSVEMAEQPDHASEFSQDMLNHTGEDALNEVSRIRLGEVFNFVPLAVSGLTAILLLLSVGGFCFLSARAAEAGESSHFAKAVDRIYFLDTKPWDRLAKIEIVGVTLLETPEVGAELIPDVLEPDENGVIRIARGSKVILHVRADAGMVIPEKCELTYTYSDGTESEAVILVPTGTIREERDKNGKLVLYKYFTLDEPPFDGPLDNFD